MLLITLFIIIFNLVSIALVYYCLDNMEKKEKVIFIAVGTAIIYVLTSFVYWISTHNVEIKAVSEIGKNLITFLFVPVNGIVILPLLAKSYRKYCTKKLKADKFRNRVIVLAVVLVIILIVECSYFRDIQNSVVKTIENQQNAKKEKNIVLDKNEIDPNLDLNLIAEGNIIYENNINDTNEVLQNDEVLNNTEVNE